MRVALLTAALLTECGGAIGEPVDASDASVSSDAEADGDSGPAGLACTTDQDCFAGFCAPDHRCCNGEYDAGVCFCGEGAPCDVNHSCCVPADASTPTVQCTLTCHF